MTDPLDKINAPARQALTFAQEEARRLKHTYIGTEHLLLGLLRDHEGVAASILRRLGIELQETRAAIEYIIGLGSDPVTGVIGLTPRAKQVIELAVAEATTLQQDLAGPEHVLLALLRARDEKPPGKGIAAGILESFGVSVEQVQAALANVPSDDDREQFRRLVVAGTWDEVKQSLAKWREGRRQGRRYSLVLPEELFAEVERLAERQHTTVVELMRRFTRLGLIATRLQETPGSALIIRDSDREREVMLL